MNRFFSKKCISAVILFLTVTAGCFADSAFDEYYNKMLNVQKNKNYLIKANLKINLSEYNCRALYKKDGSYIVFGSSKVNGKEYTNIVLFDGKRIIQKNASTGSVKLLADNIKDKKTAMYLNPVGSLIDFKEFAVLLPNVAILQPENPVFVNDNANKNGFDCRLIKVRNDREICVSDKYGIAVYERYSTSGLTQEINILSVEMKEYAKNDTNKKSDVDYSLKNSIRKYEEGELESHKFVELN